MKRNWKYLFVLVFYLVHITHSQNISGRFNLHAAHHFPMHFDSEIKIPVVEGVRPDSTSVANPKEKTEPVKSKASTGRDCLTVPQTNNIVNEIIAFITTALTNFSINDAIAIGVFLVAVVGIKIIVIAILIGVWFGLEKKDQGYEESSGYGYGSPPQIAYGVPSSSYGSPVAAYGVPSSSYGVPSSSYGAPSSSYGVPSSSYGAPSSSYGVPSSSYGAPSSSYGVPSSSYGSPAPAYGVPSPSYGSPSPAYGAPSSSYGTPVYKAKKSAYGTPPSTSYESPSIATPSSSYSTPGTSRSLSTNFEKIGEWILKSVINYISNEESNKVSTSHT